MQAEKALDTICEEVRNCKDCKLSENRKNAVPGEGPADAEVMFIGEGPGFHENEQGKPFVGQAGHFLDQLLEAAGLERDKVFITNVVKCRPPENRVPSPDEVEACAWVLDAQIDAMQPGVILALGATAVSRLLGIRAPIGQARNSEHSYRGIPVIVTYHPAALLRTPALKRPVWEDVKKLRRLMERGGLPRK